MCIRDRYSILYHPIYISIAFLSYVLLFLNNLILLCKIYLSIFTFLIYFIEFFYSAIFLCPFLLKSCLFYTFILKLFYFLTLFPSLISYYWLLFFISSLFLVIFNIVFLCFYLLSYHFSINLPFTSL